MKKIHLLLPLLFLISCIEKNAEENTQEINNKTTNKKIKHPTKFIKAAHYFANAWPKTFWQEFEKAKVDSDFEQLKKDGFNTLILVLPWVGFETNFQKQKTSSNKKMYERLDFLLKKSQEHGLDYMLRLGFPHDYSPNTGTSLVEVCSNMYEKPEQQDKWIDYLKKVKQITDTTSENLVGIFVSWEDFWCPHFIFPKLEEARRRQLAKNIGYSDWLWKKDETLLKIILGKNELKKEEITIPQKQEMSYFYYIEFIDNKFEQLVLNTAKTIFPQTAMEIRIDKDPVKSSTGENIWVAHDLYFEEKNHRGTYWAPFWGAENNYETLSLEQALFNFEYFLNYVTDQGKSTNHVIEQFNFVDNTPYFPNHAKLADKDVDSFLLQSAKLLKKYSQGYGIWAYRDYADNALYNSSFEFGLQGWDNQGVKLVGNEQDQQIEINAGGYIGQSFQAGARMMLAHSYSLVNLCINTKETGKIAIYTNDKIDAQLELKKGQACYLLSAQEFKQEQTSFKIVAESNIIIDEIKLYGFVQKLDVYDEHNQASHYRESIRKLNQALE